MDPTDWKAIADSPPRMRPKGKPTASAATTAGGAVFTALIVLASLAFIVCGGFLILILNRVAGGFREMSRPKIQQQGG